MSVFFNAMLLKTSTLSPYPSGYVQWIDASDPAGTGILPSNASALSLWVDKSGNSNSPTQGTGANQPIFTTNLLNGLPGVVFNGSKYMSSTSTNFPFGSTGRTIFIVFNPTTITNNYPWTYGTAALAQLWGVQVGGINILVNDSGGRGVKYSPVSAATPYMVEFNYPAGQLVSTTVTTLNGTTVSTTVNVSDGVLNTVQNTMIVGDYVTSGAAGFIGNIHEILFYPRALTAPEQSTVRSIMRAKWGI